MARCAAPASRAKASAGRTSNEFSAAKPRLASLVEDKPPLTVGSRVRIRPRPRGDIMDIALKDKIAVIETIEHDFDDRMHIAVTLLDDPGRDLGAAGFPGHRFYFARDELEPLAGGEAP